MTMLTFSYKKHYIHVNSIGNTKKVEAYILENPDKPDSLIRNYVVKSIRAAKLLITKHCKAAKGIE